MTLDLPPMKACPICGYSLKGLVGPHRCPECGFEYDALMVEIPTAPPADPHREFIAGAVFIMGFAVALLVLHMRVRVMSLLILVAACTALVIYLVFRWSVDRGERGRLFVTRDGVLIIDVHRERDRIPWSTFDDVHWQSSEGSVAFTLASGRIVRVLAFECFGSNDAARAFIRIVRRRKALHGADADEQSRT